MLVFEVEIASSWVINFPCFFALLSSHSLTADATNSYWEWPIN